MEMPQDSINELITKDELARRLKVTSRTINSWMTRMNLPYLKLGKIVRFDYRAVVQHLEREHGRGLPS